MVCQQIDMEGKGATMTRYQLQFQWEIMEEMQAMYPHFWFGWDGFIPMIYWV